MSVAVYQTVNRGKTGGVDGVISYSLYGNHAIFYGDKSIELVPQLSFLTLK